MEYINGTFSSIGYWKFAEFFGNDRDIASTDDVPEGNSNIYFTNSRVDSRLDSRLNSGISSLSVQNLIVTNDPGNELGNIISDCVLTFLKKVR